MKRHKISPFRERFDIFLVERIRIRIRIQNKIMNRTHSKLTKEVKKIFCILLNFLFPDIMAHTCMPIKIVQRLGIQIKDIKKSGLKFLPAHYLTSLAQFFLLHFVGFQQKKKRGAGENSRDKPKRIAELSIFFPIRELSKKLIHNPMHNKRISDRDNSSDNSATNKYSNANSPNPNSGFALRKIFVFHRTLRL